MARASSSRKPFAAVRTALRNIGLPDTLFDSDFKEQQAKAEIRRDAMLLKMAELEATDEWKGAVFPWSAERAEYLQAVQEGRGEDWRSNPFETLVQGPSPTWKQPLITVTRYWEISSYAASRVRKQVRKLNAEGKPLTEPLIRALRLHRIDPITLKKIPKAL
jgi:hypothetical protein